MASKSLATRSTGATSSGHQAYPYLTQALEDAYKETLDRIAMLDRAVFGLTNLTLPEMHAGIKQQVVSIEKVLVALSLQNLRNGHGRGDRANAVKLFRMLRDCYSLDPSNLSVKDCFRGLAKDLNGSIAFECLEKMHNKCVVAHVSCVKNYHLAEASLQSFAPFSDDEVHVIVVGRPAYKRFSKCSIGFNIKGSRLEIDAPDSYEGHYTKTMVLYTLLDLFATPKLVIKLDDDLHLRHRNRFDKKIREITDGRSAYCGLQISPSEETMYHGWHINKCQNLLLNQIGQQYPLPSKYARGGDGYILSAQSLSVLSRSFLAKRKYFSTPMLEDLCVGLLLQLNGISLLDVDLAGDGTKAGASPVLIKVNHLLSCYDSVRQLDKATLRGRKDDLLLYWRRLARLKEALRKRGLSGS